MMLIVKTHLTGAGGGGGGGEEIALCRRRVNTTLICDSGGLHIYCFCYGRQLEGDFKLGYV